MPLPDRQRHLTALILRKLLASSPQAIAATLDTLRVRLKTLRDDRAASDPEFAEALELLGESFQALHRHLRRLRRGPLQSGVDFEMRILSIY